MAVRKTQLKKEEEKPKKEQKVEESNSEEVSKEELSEEQTASDEQETEESSENESNSDSATETGSEKESESEKETEKEVAEPAESKDERTIFVKGISFQATEDDLKEMFSKYGTITEIRIPKSRDGPGGKGFGYVEFENKESCEKAKELDGKDFDGRTIVVDMARSSGARGDQKAFGNNNRAAEHTVFLGNIPFEVDHTQFLDHLKTYADVTHLRIPEDRETGRPKGFAFASLGSNEEAQKLINANITYMDRTIRAQASEKRNNSGPPRSNSFGGRDNSYGRRDNNNERSSGFGKRSWSSENTNNKRHVKFE